MRDNRKCALHPKKGAPACINMYTEYAADMTILLSYYKCVDDWKDEHKASRMLFAKWLTGNYQKVQEKYPDKCKKVEILFDKISDCEKKQEESLDKVSGLFGEVLAELFAYKNVFVEQNEEYEEKCRSILSMMMAECSKEFEKLPIIHNIELLRNILYSGVWCRYEQLRMKKERLPK